MSRLDTLIAARDLSGDIERWHQGDYACDAEGADVSACSEFAVAWCAAGAVLKVLRKGDEGYDSTIDLINSIARERYNVDTISSLNDGECAENNTPEEAHQQVLAVMDEAVLHERIRLGAS